MLYKRKRRTEIVKKKNVKSGRLCDLAASVQWRLIHDTQIWVDYDSQLTATFTDTWEEECLRSLPKIPSTVYICISKLRILLQTFPNCLHFNSVVWVCIYLHIFAHTFSIASRSLTKKGEFVKRLKSGSDLFSLFWSSHHILQLITLKTRLWGNGMMGNPQKVGWRRWRETKRREAN